MNPFLNEFEGIQVFHLDSEESIMTIFKVKKLRTTFITAH